MVNKDSNTNDFVASVIDTIKKCIREEMSAQSDIITAIVSSVNNNGTVNIYLPSKPEMVYTNISNHTPFLLSEGDGVEVLVKNGSYSNCWIIAKHGTTYQGNMKNINIDKIDGEHCKQIVQKMEDMGILCDVINAEKVAM